MRQRIAIGVVIGLSLCTLLASAQDAAPDREPPDGELRRMLVDPPDARPGFPRDDPRGFMVEERRQPVERFDPSRPAQKMLLRDVDPRNMDYSRDGRLFYVRSRNPFASDRYEFVDDWSSLGRGILRDLRRHAPITVVWLFDESRSMQDDRNEALREMKRTLWQIGDVEVNVRRALGKIGAFRERDGRDAILLSHLVGGFGQSFHFVTPAPVKTADEAFNACDHLTTDDSGIENPFHAMTSAVHEAQQMVPPGTRLVLVLMTDESGNDEDYLEETVRVLKSANAQVYVVGHDALFSKTQIRLRNAAPRVDERCAPMIRRGPESADFECLLWDGLHEREDEQLAGFQPYALARLVEQTGGSSFWLTALELQRGRSLRGTSYFPAIFDYQPELVSREEYAARRAQSPLRRALYDTIQATRDFSLPMRFPYEPRPLTESLADAAERAERQRLRLVPIEEKLLSLGGERGIEPSKRWQANYDLMVAQIVAFQVTLREYSAALRALRETIKIGADRSPAAWKIVHGRLRHAPPRSTEAGYRVAECSLKQVGERHPGTPWAALAETIRARGLSVEWRELQTDASPRPAIEPGNY